MVKSRDNQQASTINSYLYCTSTNYTYSQLEEEHLAYISSGRADVTVTTICTQFTTHLSNMHPAAAHLCPLCFRKQHVFDFLFLKFPCRNKNMLHTAPQCDLQNDCIHTHCPDTYGSSKVTVNGMDFQPFISWHIAKALKLSRHANSF